MVHIRFTHVFVVGMLVVCCLWLSAVAFADDPPAEFYLAGMQNAALSVTSGRGGVTVRDWMLKNDGNVLEVETVHQVVWQGQAFRETVTTTYITNDAPPDSEGLMATPGTVIIREIAYDGTQVTEYNSERGEAVIGSPVSCGTHGAYASYIADASIRGHGLTVPRSTSDPVPSYVRSTTGFQVVGTEIIDGDECVMLESTSIFDPPSGSSDPITNTHRMWVNPNKGYTVPRVRDWAQGGGLSQKTLMYEVDVQMRTYGGNLWGPAGFTRIQYKTDPATGQRIRSLQSTVTFNQCYQVNPTVDPGELVLQLPSGTKVHNEIIGGDYTIP